MRLRHTSLLLLLTFCSQTLLPSFARADNVDEGPVFFESPYGERIYDRPIPGPEYQDLLREHLDRLRGSDSSDPEGIELFQNGNELLLGYISSLQKINPSLCKNGDRPKAWCMKEYLVSVIEAALSEGKIDLVEAGCLNRDYKFLAFKEGKYFLDINLKEITEDSKPSPKKMARIQMRLLRKNKRIQRRKTPTLPSITEYETKKNFFRLARIHRQEERNSNTKKEILEIQSKLAQSSGHETERLNKQLTEKQALLTYYEKAPIEIDVKTQRLTIGTYLRKVRSVGRVSPMEFILVKYDRIQINKMAHMMSDYIDRLTSQSASIVFMKKNYLQINDKIEMLLQENIKLIGEKAKVTANTTLEPSELDAKLTSLDTKITQNLDLIDDLESEKFADELKKKITEKQGELELKMREQSQAKLTSTQLKSLKSELSSLQAEIEDLKTELKKECIELPIDHPDIYRASARILKMVLAEMKLKDTSLSQVSLGDVVAAGYLAGDVDPNLFKAVLVLKELQEPYVSIMKKIGQIAYDVVRGVLGMIPVTAPFVAVITMVVDSVKQVKEYRKAMANETHLF